MHWIKKGLIYNSQGRHGWDLSHASQPTVDASNERVWRVYYAARDAQNQSRTSYVELDASDPTRVLYVHPEPILPLGAPGTFDESGIMPSWLVVVDESTRYLYYSGWTRAVTVPYQNAIGLAISRDGGRTFTKAGEGPLFGPTLHEPYFTGTACVLVEDARWRCWYLSCIKWLPFEGKMESVYHFKYAESDDGIVWRRNGTVAVELKPGDEAGLAKASVIREAQKYRMWYSYRNLKGYRTDRANSFRIGYAESVQGVTWERLDHLAGIDTSPEGGGWDGEMIAYPHVVARQNELVMFYNGNGFGKSGFGYAVLPQE
jgi:hypothetical protein